ncbi:hypothetical protein ATI61_10273 [Archangium gephyra]|uniref:Uncharacterized protein n=1 Tax=Archangium gephyra TaxID=48 RepID=A0AAC8QDB6_9BACT|nr:Hypothetical protein AA314_06627 [Archangium gephyra]REG35705.1 hypothetical protein ATI61_10273 [Archangium gephyra]
MTFVLKRPGPLVAAVFLIYRAGKAPPRVLWRPRRHGGRAEGD